MTIFQNPTRANRVRRASQTKQTHALCKELNNAMHELILKINNGNLTDEMINYGGNFFFKILSSSPLIEVYAEVLQFPDIKNVLIGTIDLNHYRTENIAEQAILNQLSNEKDRFMSYYSKDIGAAYLLSRIDCIDEIKNYRGGKRRNTRRKKMTRRK
jgi:hypothetical protein